MWIQGIELLVLLILCLASDLKDKKIRNKVTFPFVVLGLLTNSFFVKELPLWSSIMGLFIPFILLYVFFMFYMIGAGDIKQMMAIGAIMGHIFIINAFFTIFAVAGMIAIGKLILNKSIGKRLKYFYEYIIRFLKTGHAVRYTDASSADKKTTFPFSIAIFGGAIINFILQHLGYFIFIA